jgi:hypothetical protein
LLERTQHELSKTAKNVWTYIRQWEKQTERERELANNSIFYTHYITTSPKTGKIFELRSFSVPQVPVDGLKPHLGAPTAPCVRAPETP